MKYLYSAPFQWLFVVLYPSCSLTILWPYYLCVLPLKITIVTCYYNRHKFFITFVALFTSGTNYRKISKISSSMNKPLQI